MSKSTIIVISCLVAVTLAKPSLHLLSSPILYAKLLPGAPIGLDGKVVDTPEVAYAKAEHAAAHINEKLNHESKQSDIVNLPAKIESLNGGAPIGIDGRVVDTPEVSLAKAEHAAAHLNEQLNAGAEDSNIIAYQLAKLQPGAPIGLDGRVIDTPEVALAKAEHAAAHINAKFNYVAQPIKYSAIPTAYSTYYASSPIVHYYI
ncbi:hypothetical protein PV328_000348 [Microctonus aethiopoides]|uniref:Uncharacterized protein n=1 Tax=Microctonus aethiopoides TaxID=144406 RepID=A0AA39FUQ6_9HYME|nr:hypothetical protein PV328_000348 [Microctonus aethiopoides]